MYKYFYFSMCFMLFISLHSFSLNSNSQRITPQSLLLKKLGCEKALIVNGDDLGRTTGSNEGVLKGFREGILTSASLMVPELYAKEAFEIIRENPDLDVGIHLVLARDDAPGDLCAPISPIDTVKSLVDSNGFFPTDIKIIAAKGRKEEMEIELDAQIKKALENGVDITHLDCHKGFYHTYDPKSLGVVIKLARRYDLPIRWQGRPIDAVLVKNKIVVPDHLAGVKGETPHEEKVKALFDIIKNLPYGITEIVFHPATSGYTEEEARSRQSDLAVVTDSKLKQFIKEQNICLIGYKTLRDFQRELRQKNIEK